MNRTYLLSSPRSNSGLNLMQKEEFLQIATKFFLVVSFLIISTNCIFSQPRVTDNRPATLGIEQGVESFGTPNFTLELLKSSQTVSSLQTTDAEKFEFTPHDLLSKRNKNGYYHLGDLNFRIKTGANGQWESFSTAANRASVKSLTPENATILAVADLANTLPESSPLQVIRYWEKASNGLALRFELKNKSNQPVEIGALGIPMIFNNNFDGKELDQAHEETVFFDPYIGRDAGYLQVVRLNGHSPVMLVVPYGKTPFEAYRPLTDDPTPQGTTFEGFHEWMVNSKAFAENEWKGSEQWNRPTSVTLNPGETHNIGVKFILTDKVENIEKTLIENNRPVAVGIPGYVVPQDVNAKLFLRYGQKIKSLEVEPKGALELSESGKTKSGWIEYAVKGKIGGRARLTITYADGLQQTVNYKIIKPESQVVADNGKFLTTNQWYENPNDLFHRSPSVITYDNEKKQQVTQDRRAWICGLSDEGGAGSWLNAIMKQLVEPNQEEIKKMETFVNQTIWGGIQYNSGKLKYGVRKSMFFYSPDSMPAGTYSPDINFKTWAAWNRQGAEITDRSYNYPHVAAAHWVMYRLARNYSGLVTKQNWQWYLENAYHTAMTMMDQAPYYAQFGQMEGTIFLLILEDLKREGYTDLAADLEKTMKGRAEHWATLSYPFGSEMSWDSTGQEEVYMWSKYFGFDEKAMVTLNAILAYMPTIPHWAYNGNARRYWDFLYGGKLSRYERMIHHYGSGLNAIPVLTQYRQTPDDLYLLRVGYGGLLGTLSNITEEGFAPCASHSFPTDLRNDGISGDYGCGYFGYAVNSATYIIHDSEFGWLAFGGNLSTPKNWVKVDLTTAAKSRIYIAPVGLWLTLDAGTFKSVSFNPKSKEVRIELDKLNEFTPKAYLRIESSKGNKYTSEGLTQNDRRAFEIQLAKEPVLVKLRQ
ncbi:DUF5695 domain-containing protein [Aquipluma nitroreducens]|nr:DUF5695 domain-containing protein [Aquipluma nitroreducens]